MEISRAVVRARCAGHVTGLPQLLWGSKRLCLQVDLFIFIFPVVFTKVRVTPSSSIFESDLKIAQKTRRLKMLECCLAKAEPEWSTGISARYMYDSYAVCSAHNPLVWLVMWGLNTKWSKTVE